MRLKVMAAVLVACGLVLATAPRAWADPPPTSQNDQIRSCPQGTTASVVNGRLNCSLTFACPSGYQAFAVGQGLICFKRENAAAAADCNECHPGGHIQVAQNEKDTCKLGGVGTSEPSKLACCNNAVRWEDKDGNLDVCGFFAAPKPQ
jgi:hypothetical protein